MMISLKSRIFQWLFHAVFMSAKCVFADLFALQPTKLTTVVLYLQFVPGLLSLTEYEHPTVL